MTTRELELNIRAKADVAALKNLERETTALAKSLQATGAAFDAANADAKQLAAAYGQLTAAERSQIQSAAQMSVALDRAAVARERAAQAAQATVAAESRSLAAAANTVAAQERAAQSATRTATAEQKLAQERERTYQASQKTERGEHDIERARQNAIKATAQAEAAELRLEKARKSGSGGLANSVQGIQRMLAGGAIVLATRQVLRFGESILDAAEQGASLENLESKFDNLAESIGSSGTELRGVLREASSGMIDMATLMQGASDLISFGLAKNVEDAGRLTNLISQLRIDPNILNLTLSNNSQLRLDALGLSIENVKNRIAELKAQGAVGDLFDQAVILELEKRLATVGDQSESTAAQITAMKATATDTSNAFKQAFAGTMAEAIRAARGEVDSLDQALLLTAEHYGTVLGRITSSVGFAGVIAATRAQIKDLGGDIFALDSAVAEMKKNNGVGIFTPETDPAFVRSMAEAVGLYTAELTRLQNIFTGRTPRWALESQLNGFTQAAQEAAQATEKLNLEQQELAGRADKAFAVDAVRRYAKAIVDAKFGVEDLKAAEEAAAEAAERVAERQEEAMQHRLQLLQAYRDAAAAGGAFFSTQIDADLPIFNDDMSTNVEPLNALIKDLATNAGAGALSMADLGIAMGEFGPDAADAAVKAVILNDAIKNLIGQWQAGIIPDAGSLLEQVDLAIAALQNADLPALKIQLEADQVTFADEMDRGEQRWFEQMGEDVEIPINGDIDPFKAALDEAMSLVTGTPADALTLQLLADYQNVLDATTAGIPDAITAIPADARTVEVLADSTAVHSELATLEQLTPVITATILANVQIGNVSGTPPGRANGGPVYNGLPYIVGERGAELFIPWTNGTVVSNGQMSNQRGMPQTFQVTNIFYGPANPEQVEQATRQAGDRFLSQFQRRGGVA